MRDHTTSANASHRHHGAAVYTTILGVGLAATFMFALDAVSATDPSANGGYKPSAVNYVLNNEESR